MSRRLGLVVAALLLAGCGGSISMTREQAAFLIDDQRASYNKQAEFVNRACQMRALSDAECKESSDLAGDAVKQYKKLRKQILDRESIDTNAILDWLVKIGAAVARAYGIPVPIPQGAVGPVGPSPHQLPLMAGD